MSFARILDLISDTLLSLAESPTVISILLVVGTFMNPTPAILIFTPIFLPIVMEFGVHPVHFGALMVYTLCVGTLTARVGNVLFVGARVAGLRTAP